MASSFEFQYEATSGETQPQAPRGLLTEREIQVLKLMAEGLSTHAIAKELGIAFKTAACHRSRVLAKIGVDNTVSAMRWAIRSGLVQP